MKKKNYIAILVMAFASAASHASEFAQQDLWNFKYKHEGHKAVLPMQVFDDGSQTIFQFKLGQRIPAIFVYNGISWEHVVPAVDGAYFYIPKIANTFKLKLGMSEAIIKYSGDDRQELSPKKPYQNQLSTRSYASVVKGDDYTWTTKNTEHEHPIEFIRNKARVTPSSSKSFNALVKKINDGTNIRVIAYGSTSADQNIAQQRADAIVNALTAYGIERSYITVKTQDFGASQTAHGEIGARVEYWTGEHFIEKEKEINFPITSAASSRNFANQLQLESATKAPASVQSVASVEQQSNYMIKASDTSIDAVLKRWGQDAGWQVIPVNFPYIALDSAMTPIHTGSFTDAVDALISGLHAKGYSSIAAKAYTNNVIEIGQLEK